MLEYKNLKIKNKKIKSFKNLLFYYNDWVLRTLII